MKLEILSSGGLYSDQVGKLLFNGRHVQIVTYLIAALVHLSTYRKGIKNIFSSIEKITLTWLNVVLWGYCFSWLASLVHYIIIITMQVNPPFWGNLVYTMFFIFFNIIYFYGFQQPEIFVGITKTKPKSTYNLSNDKKAVIANELEAYVRENNPHLTPSLTLDELASAINTPSRYLSQIINERFNLSFYDYINGLRIEAFKEIILDPADDKKTILEVLYKVGFNSKSSFNNAFKKHTNQTPTEFIKSHKKI